MGILVALAQAGKDQEVTLGSTVVTTEAHGPLTQEHIPWMDLMDPTGEEGWTGLWNKPTKTRMPKRKNPGSLVRSRGEDIVKRVLALRKTTPQKGARGQKIPKGKHTHQTSGKGLRGPGLVQTYPMMSIRGNILRQRDGRDQSNHPNPRLKMK